MSNAESTSGSPELSINGAVATIRLRRPEMANRLGPDDLRTLAAHIETVNATPQVLVLRFVSDGKYFCSGYDISSLSDKDQPGSLFFGETVDLVEQARPVTIAVIQGGVYGGGTDLSLACDFRIGGKSANMFMPATRLGLHFYPGGMVRYITRLGLDNAKRLFLLAEKIQSEQMLAMGFLTECVDDSALQGRVAELTEALAAMAPIALLGVKKHLNLIARGQVLADEINANVIQSESSSDIQEGVLAWKEKRAPRFRGE